MKNNHSCLSRLSVTSQNPLSQIRRMENDLSQKSKDLNFSYAEFMSCSQDYSYKYYRTIKYKH